MPAVSKLGHRPFPSKSPGVFLTIGLSYRAFVQVLDSEALVRQAADVITPAADAKAITLDVPCDHRHLLITVTDTGRGMPAAFLPHLFEPFRQIDASSTRSSGGLGLGLAIALTANAQVEDRLRALSAGFQIHVLKPVDPDELASIVASLIGRE